MMLKIADKLTGDVWDIRGTLNFSGSPWLNELMSGSITKASVTVPVGADLNSFTSVIGNLTYSGGSFSGAITEIDTVILNNAGTLAYASADAGAISVYTSPNSTMASGAIDSGFLSFLVNYITTDAAWYSHANFSISQSPSQLLQGNDNVVLSGALGSSFHAGAGNDSVLGSPGNDIIFGDAGDDLIKGGPGNDVIDGGAQVDTAIYAGLRSQYAITPVK